MIGSLFAGTDEAPGEMVLIVAVVQILPWNGFCEAMEAGSKDRYFKQNRSNKRKKLVQRALLVVCSIEEP